MQDSYYTDYRDIGIRIAGPQYYPPVANSQTSLITPAMKRPVVARSGFCPTIQSFGNSPTYGTVQVIEI